MKFRLKKKVKITSEPKTDGRLNEGIIIGSELCQDGCYLGYVSKAEFYGRFKVSRYKVAYIDCVTNRACVDWYDEEDLA